LIIYKFHVCTMCHLYLLYSSHYNFWGPSKSKSHYHTIPTTMAPFYLINSRYNIYDCFTTITCFPKIFSISGRRGRDRMVVGFTNTCAICAYHHQSCEFEPLAYSIQRYVRKFVCDLRQVCGFLRLLRFPPPLNKTDRHDINEILLKVTLNTINQSKPNH